MCDNIVSTSCFSNLLNHGSPCDILELRHVQKRYRYSGWEDKGLKTRESAENYLEAILVLGQSGNPVRSIDIVNELNYTKPSVCVAMRNLRASGHIMMDTDGVITLTDSGRAIAEAIYERHILISNWLIHLGVNRVTAADDACRMEHAMSEQSFYAIKKHIKEFNLHV